MTAPPPQAAVAAAAAIERTLGSPAWARALGDDDERGWQILEALCEELHPLGPVVFPSLHRLRAAVDRRARDEDIRETFDGRNYGVLARRHRLSERQIRRIVDEHPRRERRLRGGTWRSDRGGMQAGERDEHRDGAHGG